MGGADAGAGIEVAERVASEGHDNRWIEDLELALQVRRAGRNLVRLRIAIARRTALDDVRDEDVLTLPADLAHELIEQRARRTDKRPALLVLVVAGTLADKDDFRFRVAFTGHSQRPGLVQWAARADGDLCRDLLERETALFRRHAVYRVHSCRSALVGHGRTVS